MRSIRIESALGGWLAASQRAKRRLAREIVALYHSEEAASRKQAAFDRMFKEKAAPRTCPSSRRRARGSGHLPALLKDIGLVSSNGEGRRMIAGGGVRIDGEGR
jgi:tyrosyl-tRNA synthetase